MDEFKIRASACGKIMSNAKVKGELSATCKSYLQEWYSDDSEPIRSKYIDKGLMVEDELIDFMCWQLGVPKVTKNQLFRETEYMRGTCDVLTRNCVIDVKAAWSKKTLDNVAIDGLNPEYYWQGQVYMHLYEVDEFIVFHGLVDTPAEVNFGIPVSYSYLADDQRWIAYRLKRDKAVEQQIIDKVIQCREWLEKYDKSITESLGKTHSI